MEYWETCDGSKGGAIVDICETGLSVRSLSDIEIGAELRMSIFFSVGNEFDQFQAMAKTTSKDVGCEQGWELYIYELRFLEISEQDRLKLRTLLGMRQANNINS